MAAPWTKGRTSMSIFDKGYSQQIAIENRLIAIRWSIAAASIVLATLVSVI